MNTKVFTTHVSLQLADKVDQIAARMDRQTGFECMISQEEERRRLTLEALADVDARYVIDHQAVQAWANSLTTETPLPVLQ